MKYRVRLAISAICAVTALCGLTGCLNQAVPHSLNPVAAVPEVPAHALQALHWYAGFVDKYNPKRVLGDWPARDTLPAAVLNPCSSQFFNPGPSGFPNPVDTGVHPSSPSEWRVTVGDVVCLAATPMLEGYKPVLPGGVPEFVVSEYKRLLDQIPAEQASKLQNWTIEVRSGKDEGS